MKALEFNVFLKESRNYKTLSEKEAMDYCITNCREWINSRIQVENWVVSLYRGGKNIQEISYTNPQLEEVERSSKYGTSTDKIIYLLNKYQQQGKKISQNRKKSIFYTSDINLAEFHSDNMWHPNICAAILPDKAKVSHLPKDFNLHDTVREIRGIVQYFQEIVNIYSTKFNNVEWLEEGFSKWILIKNPGFEGSNSFLDVQEKEKELGILIKKLSGEIKETKPSKIYSNESKEEPKEERNEYWSESEVILIPYDKYYKFRDNLLEYMKNQKII